MSGKLTANFFSGGLQSGIFAAGQDFFRGIAVNFTDQQKLFAEASIRRSDRVREKLVQIG
ncbi:MAG: hypothetical protein SCH72_13215 [Desulfuromonadales bacterium]|nr:hypothetical protein [Desulfuromonadales bacterium]